MSGDGYQVDPQALKQTADGINGIIDELKSVGVAESAEQGRGFSGIALSGLELGDSGLANVLQDFCQRWEWGVRTLVLNGNDIASRLHLSAGLYHEQEQYLTGVLKDVAAGAIGNPRTANDQVEKESWSQIGSDATSADYSSRSFAQAGRHTAQVWSGEKTDLEQLGEKSLGPGVGTILSQGQRMAGS